MTPRFTTSPDRMYRAGVIGALALPVVLALLAGADEPVAQPLELPSYIVLTHGFAVLAALCICFLAGGRYQVLRDRVSRGAVLAFGGYSVCSVLYLLWWPGLRPDGQSLVGITSAASAWLYPLSGLLLAVPLIAAAVGPQRETRRPLAVSAALWLAGVAALSLLTIAAAPSLPPLLQGGHFTLLGNLLAYVAAGLLLGAAVLSLRGYRHSGDRLLAYLAFAGLLIAAGVALSAVSGQRYHPLWYLSRLAIMAGCLLPLFCLLWDYVGLYRAEQERTRQVEALAQESRQRAEELDAIINSIADGVSISDREGRLIRHNAAAARMLHYEGFEHSRFDERYGRCVYRRADGTDFDYPDLPLNRALRGETVTGETIEMVWPDGSSTWVTSSAAPLRSASGELTGAVLTNTDRTAMQQAQDAREQAYARLRALFDHRIGGIGIIVGDSEGQVLEANDHYLQLVGYTREELEAGQVNWRELTPPEHRAVDDRALSQLQERGVSEGAEKEYVARDGRRVPVLIIGTLIPGGNGEMLAFVLDLSDRRAAEQERDRLLAQVQQERGRLFSVLSTFPAYVCLLTPEHEVAFANRRFAELFGDCAPGQKCYELIFGYDRPCENCQSFVCLREGGPSVWEWTGPDGTTFEVYDYPFTDTDGSRVVLEVGFDITARKAAAEELQRHRDHLEDLVAHRTADLETNRERLRALAAELVTAEQRERQRIAGVLHDEVAQPLGAIKLHLALLGSSHPEAEEEARRLLDYSDEAIARVRGIMSDLSHPVLQRLGIAEATAWWGEVVRERHGLPVEVQAPEEPLRLERTLEAALFQSLKELIQNAAKHSRASAVRISFARRDGGLSVTVADDGVGFDPAEVQVRSEGGFGLFSIQERVAYLGGEMTIASSPGEGTEITLRLPHAREAPAD